MTDVECIEVYRRDGCPFCVSLERRLATSGLPVRFHDIWADDEARAFVRAHNRGNETVPTVAVGQIVLTNPSLQQIEDAVRSEAPELLAT